MENIKKILIAIDDGPTSEKVASDGFQLWQQLNAEIALISVVDTTALMTDGGVTPGELADIIKNDFKKISKCSLTKYLRIIKSGLL